MLALQVDVLLHRQSLLLLPGVLGSLLLELHLAFLLVPLIEFITQRLGLQNALKVDVRAHILDVLDDFVGNETFVLEGAVGHDMGGEGHLLEVLVVEVREDFDEEVLLRVALEEREEQLGGVEGRLPETAVDFALIAAAIEETEGELLIADEEELHLVGSELELEDIE